MKKIHLLTVALVAMLFVTSCQKDEAIETMTQENLVSYNLGCNLLPADAYAALPVATEINLKTLPSSVYLNVPPVGNQGGEGSCVAWGTTYAARSASYQYAHGGSYNYGVNIFSPEYVYNQIKVSNCASGSYTTDALYLLRNQGVCTWNTMPYTDYECYTQPNSTQIAEAANYEIYTFGTVYRYVNSIKSQLAAGKVVIVAGNVYYEYMYLGGNDAVITSASGSSYGGHCYACVGYDDAKDAFLFMNSWGTNYATNGFGWIDYDIIRTYWREAYVLYE